ncbi:MAG: MFS transporter [Oscillatoria sp. PMC 1068.18]|nr:MFS transporter [Oscillatoria sp. PMC 1076.18]MEC4987174.1 MFS transporter [Oscillatoria sp. PMC 1068.18]
MKLQTRGRTRGGWGQRLLRWVNLRPEEGERTFLMFAFYTATSVGLLWLEQTAVALFLAPYPEGFGTKWLPIIYITSALMGSGLGFLYSWLQSFLPMQTVLVAIAVFMALPLSLFRFGLSIQYGIISLVTVFVLRLWMDATDVLNDLNSQVAANQLFNIREIKRTYPLISSGLLIADVISGFSLPLLLLTIGLKNVLIAASVMIVIGASTLFYLTKRYKHAFPDSPVRELEDLQESKGTRNTSSPLKKYIIPLFAFFVLGEILFLLVEFEYFGQLEMALDTSEIASFLGLFSGILGLCELATQLFVSSRAVERLGVFIAAMFLPVSLSILGLVTLIFDTRFGTFTFQDAEILFIGVIILKFIDELLRYTLIAGIEPALFQPIPEQNRGSIQAFVQGVAEPLAAGLTGLGILATIALVHWVFPDKSAETQRQIQSGAFISAIVVFSSIWAVSAWLLRSSYLSLLVQSAAQGRLKALNVDLKAFKRAVLEALEEREAEADKRSCIQLLEQIDPAGAGEVLAPLLVSFSPGLQRQSLKAMLKYPNQTYFPYVQRLIASKPNLEVLALALRYVWLSQPELETRNLKPYLSDRVDAMLRGTAAGLMLARGSRSEQAEATKVLEKMLKSKRERERAIATGALQEKDQSEELGQLANYPENSSDRYPSSAIANLVRNYIPKLLQDDSARVRCALLEVIAAKRLEEYYPSLIKGLYYKTTREAAKSALQELGNEGLPLLIELLQDPRAENFASLQAGKTIAAINTPEAKEALVQQLLTSWGTTRRNLLRIILKMPEDAGIEAVNEQIGRSGVETMFDQELLLLGQILAAMLDLNLEQFSSIEVELLRSALSGMQADIFERCFLLMKLLYPFGAIQAAIFNLNSDSQANIALGLEILDNTLDIPQKRLFLEVLDRAKTSDKLVALSQIVPYQPMSASDRLRRLLEFRHFISDWCLACCFYLARQAHWSLTREATLACLRHPTGFVREAVLAYLREASPRTCLELLAVLKNDPDPLVSAQVERLQTELESELPHTI